MCRQRTQLEHDLELVRRQIDPRLPSRLSAIFAFGSKRDATKWATEVGRPLDDVREFKLVESDLNRVYRCNMQIISMMRAVGINAGWGEDALTSIYRQYWTQGERLRIDIPAAFPLGGRRERECGVTWEWLIEGRLELVGEPRHLLRAKAP